MIQFALTRGHGFASGVQFAGLEERMPLLRRN